MRRAFALLAAALVCSRVLAHDEPTSFIDLRLGADGIDASVTASTTDLAHDLPAIEPARLLEPATLDAVRTDLAGLLQSRLRLSADGAPLAAELRTITPIPAQRDLRFQLHFAAPGAPARLTVQARLFPYDPRHRTYLNIYQGGRLLRQETFEGDAAPVEFQTSARQGIGAVVAEFAVEGVHHIFIGPDHILFIVGLMLLGGSFARILTIVTAFTIAHSLTLGLATFRIVNPPAALVEPAIALSIVFVGVHAFLGKATRDPRLVFAFCFGLIHGFGFANVLQEMSLPRQALGWSLFAFNAGVEIGQACIVAVVAPVLALLHRRRPVAARRLTAAGALGVTTAGGFWFFQRVFF